MASDVDICNMALVHVGAEAEIVSIDPPDGTVEAGRCARFYKVARQALLEEIKPQWAKKRVALAQVANNSLQWAYAYAVPERCAAPLRIITQSQLTNSFSQAQLQGFFATQMWELLEAEEGSAAFTREGDVLRTQEPVAQLIYIEDVTDASRFSANWAIALSYKLAGFLAGPTVKGAEGANAASRLFQIANAMASKEAALDARGSSSRNTFTPMHLAARM